MNIKKIIISRTDSIGDVVLTLPLIGLIKQQHPETKIVLLGQNYTYAIAKACVNIDEFIDWSEVDKFSAAQSINWFRSIGADMIVHVFPRSEIAWLAKKAKIAQRIGTTNRLYHWKTCNHLVFLSRRKSPLHEAQLNLKLARSIVNDANLSLAQLPTLYGIQKFQPLPEHIAGLIDKKRFNLILHPKSKGSAREWGTSNFVSLTKLLPADKFNIFITGTQLDGKTLQQEGFFEFADNVTDLCGKLTLDELISFIALADGLIAASTGPLHLAAALGKIALGIYPPIKPMHPGRWAPIGEKASYLVADKNCNDCRKTGSCHCMMKISPESVKQKLELMIC